MAVTSPSQDRPDMMLNMAADANNAIRNGPARETAGFEFAITISDLERMLLVLIVDNGTLSS